MPATTTPSGYCPTAARPFRRALFPPVPYHQAPVLPLLGLPRLSRPGQVQNRSTNR